MTRVHRARSSDQQVLRLAWPADDLLIHRTELTRTLAPPSAGWNIALTMEPGWSFRYSKPVPPGGPLVEMSAGEMERHLIARLEERESDKADALWQLARFYAANKQPDRGIECLRQVMALQSDPEIKAHCVLAMGQAAEQVQDYESALRFYKEALAMEPMAVPTWYFIHNNLGYCLNTLGRFSEGEAYCRKAIEIDETRPNAYKNLGMSLVGQGVFDGAARCYIAATRANASDRRSFDLLNRLLAEHNELRDQFDTDFEYCCQAVEFVARETAETPPIIHRGLRKHLVLFQSKLQSVLRRLWKRGLRRVTE